MRKAIEIIAQSDEIKAESKIALRLHLRLPIPEISLMTAFIAVGVAISSENTNNSLNNNRGKVSVGSTSVSIYGNYTQDKFYSDALLNYGWNNFTVARNTSWTSCPR